MHERRSVDFEACFLGPKGENKEFFKELLREAFDNHVAWRAAFHHDDDAEFVTAEDQNAPAFLHTQERIRTALTNVEELLKRSQPFFSPRYIGHMNWEVMMASVVAYFAAMLYNPNNVAWAGSTGTSDLELEVGRDLMQLFGIDPLAGWGHITAGGTIANIEALWMARNLKVLPLGLRQVVRELGLVGHAFTVNGHRQVLGAASNQDLLRRYGPLRALDLRDAVLRELEELRTSSRPDDITIPGNRELADLLDRSCLQCRGLRWGGDAIDLGAVLLPQTKHYSLIKAMDLLGLGRDAIRYIPVNQHYRMDMDALEATIRELAPVRPILAVIGVLGSTEESAVDEIHRMVELREHARRAFDIDFHLHVDGAYGGYARALFLDIDGHFMQKDELDARLKELSIIGDKPERSYASWPCDETFKAYEALPKVDTITVDPHKLGYIPYPAGAVVLSDRRMREAIQAFAPYVFPRPKKGEPDQLIGSYILEGSKPGAAAAAVWTAHRVLPLDIGGYGKLIGETIDGAQALWWALDKAEPFDLGDGRFVIVRPLAKPDLNIVNYVFNFVDNDNLEILNALTGYICQNVLTYRLREGESILQKSFIISSTDFTEEEYGAAPSAFLGNLGISQSEWDRVHTLTVCRSVIMSPYLTPDYVDEEYATRFVHHLRAAIHDSIPEIRDLAERLTEPS